MKDQKEWYQFKNADLDFSAPVELAKRKGKVESENQVYRTDFMRDRDRVLYCSAFRRLSGKTQIYLTGTDDHQRNRLTHTLEVSQIARTISHALRLDCNLTEAIALGHDLGHTPFGHAGEQMLHEIMSPSDTVLVKKSPMNNVENLINGTFQESMLGFKHNIQSVRVAVTIESDYGENGLNLTNYTLWGMMNHSRPEYSRDKVRVYPNFFTPSYIKQYNSLFLLPGCKDERNAWSFEALVVREADTIAQWHHDLEDALRGYAMTGKEVCECVETNMESFMVDDDLDLLADLKGRTQIDTKYITDFSRVVVNTLVNRLVRCSMHNLDNLWIERNEKDRVAFFKEHSSDDEEIQGAIGLQMLDAMDNRIDRLRDEYGKTISTKIHHSQEVERMNAKGQYIIRKLFQAYYSHPQQLSDEAVRRCMSDLRRYNNLPDDPNESIGPLRAEFENIRKEKSNEQQKIILMRHIADHIAGMTDHFAMEEFKNLYN